LVAGGYMAADQRVHEKELLKFVWSKRKLHEVMKDEVDLDHWIQENTWRRSTYFRGEALR
jgi:hypothetical protein